MIPDLLIAVQRVGAIEVPLPRYQTAGSAGLDLYAALKGAVVVAPLGRVKVPTGLAVAIPDKFEGQVRPRSGLAARTGLTVLNAPGTIDSDFRGEIEVLLVNLGDTAATIEPLDRVAQLVLAPVARAELVVVDSLVPTERGAGGYGSTGGNSA
ncbi:MAG: dUTP diphosphatase [Myxococcales bacterium]|jgi:dUTP pyrophosphatase